jgi:hypothetical protein
MNLLHQYDDWRRSWDLAVMGGFAPGGLLLYDRSAGTGAFYSVDAHGGMNLLHQYDDWRRSWDLAVMGGFAPGGLLLYDRSAVSSVITSKPAKHNHLKTGQRGLKQD